MKKLLSLFSFVVFAITSCTGPVGPEGIPGPQGLPGPQGEGELAKTFELEANFTADNQYSRLEPYGFEVFNADVTLVYILWEVDNNGNELWRALPQTAYLDEGLLTYNFDFTNEDVSIFLDGTIPDLATVGSEYLAGQIFRVVVIPGEFVDAAKVDRTYTNIVKKYNLSESSFKRRK